MSDRASVLRTIDDDAKTTVEFAKMHDVNMLVVYDTGDNTYNTAYTLDDNSAIEFATKMILMLKPEHQDYAMKFVVGKIKAQRGIVDKPKRKFSILWGLVSFG